MQLVRQKWSYWRGALQPAQLRLVNRYRNRILPLIHPFLSVLCRHKQPLHHSDPAVHRHLNAGNWREKVLPSINSPTVAHHLFDPDACLYYVSGTGDYGLLAFDIDSKDGKTDALSFARE